MITEFTRNLFRDEIDLAIKEINMKTCTPMLKVIKKYGEIMRGFGVNKPIFLLNHDCYMAIANPDGAEFDENEWTPFHEMPENIRNTPGLIGEYFGVLLIQVYNRDPK